MCRLTAWSSVGAQSLLSIYPHATQQVITLKRYPGLLAHVDKREWQRCANSHFRLTRVIPLHMREKMVRICPSLRRVGRRTLRERRDECKNTLRGRSIAALISRSSGERGFKNRASPRTGAVRMNGDDRQVIQVEICHGSNEKRRGVSIHLLRRACARWTRS